MEVVFTLLAERYERGGVLLTSNLPFSKWEGIFKDSMTTAAVIDRLVHHSVIVELSIPSYRQEQARNNGQALGTEPTTETRVNELSSGSGLRLTPPAGSSEANLNVVAS